MTQFNSPYYFPFSIGALSSDRKFHHHHPSSSPHLQTTTKYPGYFKEHNAQQPAPSKQMRTTIGHLYPEILTEIFSKLDIKDKGRVAQVCSGWRDAVYAKRCWKGVEAKFHMRKSSQVPAFFSSLIKRGIRKVHILSIKKHSLKDILISLPQLESLNLSGIWTLSDDIVAKAFHSKLPNLRVLNLSLCKRLTDESIKRIAVHAKNLEELELGGCENITNEGVMFIPWGLKKLRRLNLRSCWNISDQAIAHLAAVAPGKETETALPLEFLGLQDCQHLTDEALKFIADGLPTLRALNLSFCVSITDQGLRHLSRMQQLEELNLSACDNIMDPGMAFLTENNYCHLRSLDLSFCEKIGDLGLGYIAQAMFQLRSLNLSACRITDVGFIKVIRALHELEDIQIGQCSSITDESIKVFAEELPNLRAIDVYGCTKITQLGLGIILKLPKLEHLNLGLWQKR